MKTVSMLELRSRGKDIVQRLKRGESLKLTYRGKKVATLLPEMQKKIIPENDPVRTFHQFAEPMGSMTSEDIDQLLYGESPRLS